MSEENRKLGEDEEPVEISNLFFLKVLGYGMILAVIIIGIPYVVYNLRN